MISGLKATTIPEYIAVLAGIASVWYSRKENILVSTAEIILITSASPYIAIHTEKKKYLHTSTLRNIALQLDPDIFVRVHKTTIINSHFVLSYRSRLNGDYDIVLKNQQEIRLSRNYVQAFRKIMTIRSSA